MSKTIKVAILGDFNPQFSHHHATDESLRQSAARLGIEVQPVWVPTDSLEEDAPGKLNSFDAIWCSSGSPYRSMNGALEGIRFAREKNWPFFAT
jgi:CTP synthase (UTP-ammonia lyase)